MFKVPKNVSSFQDDLRFFHVDRLCPMTGLLSFSFLQWALCKLIKYLASFKLTAGGFCLLTTKRRRSLRESVHFTKVTLGNTSCISKFR